jgi:hypothetical protein
MPFSQLVQTVLPLTDDLEVNPATKALSLIGGGKVVNQSPGLMATSGGGLRIQSSPVSRLGKHLTPPLYNMQGTGT